jgi:hypothetical protein
MIDNTNNSVSSDSTDELVTQYRYRRIFVKDETLIDVPAGTQCLQIRKAAKDRSFVEFLEPVRDD